MAAEKAEEFSTYLAEKNIDELLFDFENFARRKPEIFLGTAFVGGLLLGRFIKSSNSRDYNGDEYYRSSDYSAESRPYTTHYTSSYGNPEVSRPISQSEYGTPGAYTEREAKTDGPS